MENEKILKLSDFAKNETNPFIEKAIKDVQFSKKYKTASKTDQKAILQAFDPNTGEILGHTMFIRQIEVDEQRFTKLYLSEFESFWDLPKSAIRVFGYIMTKMIKDDDKVEFRISECIRYTKYKSKKPVYEGLTALMKSEIIARGYNEYVYFVNPLISFNGNRVSYIKTFCKRRKEEKREVKSSQLGLFEHSEKEPSAI